MLLCAFGLEMELVTTAHNKMIEILYKINMM